MEYAALVGCAHLKYVMKYYIGSVRISGAGRDNTGHVIGDFNIDKASLHGL